MARGLLAPLRPPLPARSQARRVAGIVATGVALIGLTLMFRACTSAASNVTDVLPGPAPPAKNKPLGRNAARNIGTPAALRLPETPAAAAERGSTGEGGSAQPPVTVDLAASPASAFIQYLRMAPGDAISRPITVANAGTVPLRYAISSVAGESTLAGALQLTINTCGGTGSLYGPGRLAARRQIELVRDRRLAPREQEKLCFHVALPLSTDARYEELKTTVVFTFDAEQD